MTVNISLIGAGSMAEALIAGWTNEQNNGRYHKHIQVTNHSNNTRLRYLEETYQVKAERDPASLIQHSDVIILACKPKDWQEALTPYLDYFTPEHTLISVMAGITTEDFESFFPFRIPVIRAIPNTSAVVNEAMTPYACGQHMTPSKHKIFKNLFLDIGDIQVVDENQMDAMTALTGTGPAYIYYLMESMEKAAIQEGIDPEMARKLVSQTLLGAGIRVKSEDIPPKILYEQIMSPGGTTEAGFKILQEHQVQSSVIDCISAACNRSKELGQSLTSNSKLKPDTTDKQ
ncbi:pyrroline-5-carboxylate reductase [Salisediminibacterium beveridgei]|uniref:Pyrroline-5-carboxylate reductase n=1 Tax=Salisediminibacterium beveridgei TaxID=632773 RepID=A0A1D7QUQ3_9BACI|nr:pyrroline-5-carboxylate reductase [Salisediminibacterium beveridgei]AOM82715.1 Pyrroline-5-carboxylate reductase [Salisediminibacterium beveridgei]